MEGLSEQCCRCAVDDRSEQLVQVEQLARPHA